jgi:hypothetical protein
MANTATSTHNDYADHTTSARRISTETKASYKTTELIAYVVAVVGVLVASAITDTSDFGTQEAWFFVTLLTIGYTVSRGLAKSGSREPFDDEYNPRRGQHALSRTDRPSTHGAGAVPRFEVPRSRPQAHAAIRALAAPRLTAANRRG